MATKEEVIDYVMTTPNNPNRAVLEGMLDGISGTQLPSPTESDNGKVLGVDGGEYKLVDGANVEVIKIGSASGGGNNYEKADGTGDGQTWEISGGGFFSDGKTLEEILNGKRIVSLAFDVPLGENALYVKSAFVGVQPTGKTMYDIKLAQNYDEYKSQKSLTILADVMQANSSVSPNGKAIDIYAICI